MEIKLAKVNDECIFTECVNSFSIMPYHFSLVVCPLVNIDSYCLEIHPNWFSGFRTVLEFQVAFLDLGKYWKAKNNGES